MSSSIQEIKVCRYCFDDETENNPLIAPCKCKGSAKYIHEDCLNNWISQLIQGNMEKRCEVCKYVFKLEVTTKSKCDPMETLATNPSKFCFFILVCGLLVILISLLVLSIKQRYVSYDKNLGYFLGILTVFFVICVCIVGVLIRLLKGICIVKCKSQIRVRPFKAEDNDFDNTNILNSLNRVESFAHDEFREYRQIMRVDVSDIY